MTYADKLKSPLWQKKRLEIFERDKWSCQSCGDTKSTLNIHHRRYKSGCDPWEYPNEDLVTLCENCHKIEREAHVEIEEMIISFLKPYLVKDLGRIYAALTEPGMAKFLCETGETVFTQVKDK